MTEWLGFPTRETSDADFNGPGGAKSWADQLQANGMQGLVGAYRGSDGEPFFALRQSVIVHEAALAEFRERAAEYHPSELSEIQTRLTEAREQFWEGRDRDGADDGEDDGEDVAGRLDYGNPRCHHVPGYSVEPFDMDADGAVAALESAQEDGLAAFPSFVYFDRPMWGFRPGAEIDEGNTGGHVIEPFVVPGSAESAPVHVIDTGTMGLGVEQDVVVGRNDRDGLVGHGPVIKGIIEKRWRAADCTLTRLRYEQSQLGLPISHPDEEINIRAFDAHGLLASLSRVRSLEPGGEFVLNLSLSTPGSKLISATPSGAQWPVKQWIDDNPNVNVVAAAGNDSSYQLNYPAAWLNVIGVGSMDPLNPLKPMSISDFSNRGSWVDVYSVGRDVAVSYPTPSQPSQKIAGTWSGTSFATPQIAAEVAAGVTQAELKKRPKPK